MTERCGNCRFRQPDTDVCRRYPPTIDVVDNKEISFLVVVFPDIGWCGEWRPERRDTFVQDVDAARERLDRAYEPWLN